MASIKKILKNNDRKFINDMKKIRSVVISCESTCAYMNVNKCEVLRWAESTEIKYYISNKVFVNKRDTVVIY